VAGIDVFPIREADLLRDLDEGRAAWLETATDWCRITKPGVGAPVLDETTGVNTHPAAVVVYEGPCKFQVRSDVNSNVVEVTAGEREWAYQTATCQIPVITPTGSIDVGGVLRPVVGSTGNVRVDHTVTVVASEGDPELVTRQFQIRALHHKSHATSRRLRITEAVA
jgi:hypothetical protein